MRRTDLKTRIALLTAVGALVLAPTAAAEEAEVVPPDNSAVNQYTETYPTGGGGRDVHKGERNDASPKQVLGDRNAKRLEQEGPTGRAAAEVAAETAPSSSGGEPASRSGDETPGSQAVSPTDGGDNAGGGGGGSAGGGDPPLRQGAAPSSPATDSKVDLPDGDAGVSEVIAQATGSSSDGELGLLLPLVILAAIGWAVALLLRRRQDRVAH